MVQLIPQPDARKLLPPFLACLPAAFASPRPPPALLPLLSPILRQRVQLLSSDTSSTESWISLLCWDNGKASKLPSIVESDAFEPHPASGEIEFGDVHHAGYRWLDEETLQANMALRDFGLAVIYLWCTGDQEGGGDGWRVAELSALEDMEKGGHWFGSISEAKDTTKGVQAKEVANGNANGHRAVAEDDEDGEDDDSYWAQYDATPGRTPAAPRSPAHGNTFETHGRPRTTSEAEYFDQYAEVQPAMDGHDPSEEQEAIGESTLHGDEIGRALRNTEEEELKARRPPSDEWPVENEQPMPPPYSASERAPSPDSKCEISQPRASSSLSSQSNPVARLEETAASQSQAEIGIKQHISTSLKALFRLARSSGIEREEFERLVRTELDTLSLLEQDV